MKSKIAAGLLVGLSFASSSQAASISYFLDQSDKLADGTNYLQVTISDGANGAIDFTVTALQPLLDLAADEGLRHHQVRLQRAAGREGPAEERRLHVAAQGLGLRPAAGHGRLRPLRPPPARHQLQDAAVAHHLLLDRRHRLRHHRQLRRTGPGFRRRPELLLGPRGRPEPALRRSRRPARPPGPTACKPTDAFFGGVQAVPAPPAIWLLGTAVAGLAVRRFRSRTAA